MHNRWAQLHALISRLTLFNAANFYLECGLESASFVHQTKVLHFNLHETKMNFCLRMLHRPIQVSLQWY